MTQIAPVEFAGDPLAFAQALGHASIREYQEFHGLTPDDWAGPITQQDMTLPRCGVPDILHAGLLQIPRTCMDPVAVSYSFSGMQATRNDILAAWDMALGEWNQVCGINLVLVASLDSARIWATAGPLKGGTLAWSYLPQNSCSNRMEQRYNTTLSQRDYLAKVILHEVGHACGLEHSRNQQSIMFPSIQQLPFSAYPHAEDIKAMQERYGQPGGKPPGEAINVVINGVRYVPATQ